MIVYPISKINIGLNVLKRRDDGFHNLSTLFYPIGLRDILEIKKSNQFKFSSSGLEIKGNLDSNLCVRAYTLLKNDFNLGPVEIYLYKVIPMGAGVGGGSSDGAYTIKVLNEIFELNIPTEKLQDYALKLGSDCPFFIDSIPAIGAGQGEKLSDTSIDLDSYYFVLICPDIHISTKVAFEKLNSNRSMNELSIERIDKWKSTITNDFEEGAFSMHPILLDYKNELYDLGALYASMSGTGSSIYGIFDKKINLDKAKFRNEFVWESE
ncbi:MAG: 4-(cytidine 5'-diphospho)-2-C-methyl-D-erythritol kinase [Flavobacteriales bacterium]|nr:4-(cytidine 5'-diphospho)-2-C-methyl-D-erythritol kinase [Flavobacteriales bacterium]